MRGFIEQTYGDNIIFLHERFDMCIIGFDETTMGVAYSIPKCIDIISVTLEMEEDEAKDYFYKHIFCHTHHNDLGAPIFLTHPDHGNFAWFNN